MQRDIIVNGLRYFAPAPNSKKSAHEKGFRGKPYTVLFYDGEMLHTDDLQWDVEFRNNSRPDHAIIMSGWKFAEEKNISVLRSTYQKHAVERKQYA